MKRFLKTILIYAAVLSGLTLIVNQMYYIRHTKPNNNTVKFSSVPYGIEICNLGSSHGLNGFNYVGTDKVCFNFALGSQRLCYDSRLLRYYLSHLSENAVVFIPVSYFSFFGPEEEERPDFASKNRRYYDFLPGEYIIGYSIKEKIRECWLPALAFTADERLFDALFPHAAHTDNWSRTVSPEDAAKDGEKRYVDHVKNNLGADEKRLYNGGDISSLYEMISLCREKGIEPILVTTPYLSEYPDAIRESDPGFFTDFYAVIDEVQERTGIRYFDYSMDARFQSAYSLFMNVDHLNREGAKLFTDILIREALES